MRTFERSLIWLEKSGWVTISLVGLTAFLINGALSLFGYFPKPAIHDEFSYLLAADTFAQGRLTNPTHPMWVHFETMHVNQQPTYASMYPPGQGLILALGQVAAGHPVVGVWLGIALGCAALTWMLMAWLPVRWAYLGGLIAVFHPLILQWGQNYWGGGVAMIGGALVLGAFRRLVPEPRGADAIVLGAGMAILANTRPYEGFVLCVLVCVALATFLLRDTGAGWRVMLKRVVLPVCAVLVPVALWMGYYNYRVVGDPLLMPRLVYDDEYRAVPLFVFRDVVRQPVYRHRVIRDFNSDWEIKNYHKHRSFGGFLQRAGEKSWHLAQEYFRSWGLLLPLVILPWVFKQDRWIMIALLFLIVCVLAMLPVAWVFAHYAAPVMGLVFIMALYCMRALCHWHWYRCPVGRWIAQASVILCFCSGVYGAVRITSHIPESLQWAPIRAHILSRLHASGGKYLLLVRYRADHNYHNEWVYNRADIDDSQVVWAREMDEEQNRKLIDYFKDRQPLLFEADELIFRPVRYPAVSSGSR